MYTVHKLYNNVLDAIERGVELEDVEVIGADAGAESGSMMSEDAPDGYKAIGVDLEPAESMKDPEAKTDEEKALDKKVEEEPALSELKEDELKFDKGAAAIKGYSRQDIKDLPKDKLQAILVGLPAAYLTGRIKPGQPILTEALGLVFVCGGLAIWLEVSFLIASMAMGSVIANVAKHHEYPFHAIEGIEWPFLVVFFVLAGALLDLNAIIEIGLIGIIYILCRATGKFLGARIGSQFSSADQVTKNWMGVALFPQAGVAIGMGLVASNNFPEYRQVLLSVVISSTVFFEIIGPVFTRLALKRAHNA